MRVSEQRDLHVLRPEATPGLNSPTTSDLSRSLARHLRHFSSTASMKLVESRTCSRVQLRYAPRIASHVCRRQSVELAYALIVSSLCQAAPQDATDWEVHFSHPPALDPASYGRYFKCQVRFRQAQDALILPSGYLDGTLNAASSKLHQRERAALNRAICNDPSFIARKVERVVRRHLASHAPVSIRAIAAQLGFDIRTLQRRLASLQLTFEGIVDSTRRAVATTLLADSEIKLAQVASMLGYSEQSSLNRACMRWFAATPAAERRRCLNANERNHDAPVDGDKCALPKVPSTA